MRIHPDHCAGLVAWELEAIDNEKTYPILREHNVLIGKTESYAGFFGIPSKQPRQLFIANAGIFTSESDVDRLGDAIQDAVKRLG